MSRGFPRWHWEMQAVRFCGIRVQIGSSFEGRTWPCGHRLYYPSCAMFMGRQVRDRTSTTSCIPGYGDLTSLELCRCSERAAPRAAVITSKPEIRDRTRAGMFITGKRRTEAWCNRSGCRLRARHGLRAAATTFEKTSRLSETLRQCQAEKNETANARNGKRTRLCGSI